MSAVTPPPHHTVPASRRVLAVMVLIPLLAALALWAFAWPATRMAPRDLPLGVAGPAAAAAPLEQRLASHEGAFEIHRYADEAAARTAVQNREVYGVVVATPQGPHLLTASAASPVVAQLLTQAISSQAPPAARAVPVTDVVPTPAADVRGAGFGASVLPLALAGVAAGALVSLSGLRGGRAVTAVLGASVLVGLAGAGLAHSWLGVLAGNWWAAAGVLALTVAAVAAGVAGLHALLGKPGIGLGAFLIVLLGNPFSGAAGAPQLLPEPAGLVGQWLPPGAGSSLLRSVAFFDGAGAAAPTLVLSLWAVLGLTAIALTGRRTAPAHTDPAPVQPSAPTSAVTYS
ncbi:ABC transporter permease [Streptomyces virginiae]|uniref:ABC transporter permease n=1 Tax=Streptomyces virginiae TaxID=1961 RepID=UPI002DB83AD0|nr:ABC transporter permease [Streptomyces sp. CMAA1738]MEC4573968.1 ABC transporter permease [Streptomyces sp. CMAA1738]